MSPRKKHRREVWKDIPGYEGYYQASTYGRVKSLERSILDKNGKSRIVNYRVLRASDGGAGGYFHVILYKDIRKTHVVHGLVAITFLDKDYVKKGLCVNHKNSIRTDNRLSNLEIVTQSQNIYHSYKNGRKKAPHGSNHKNSKLTEKKVIKAREMYKSGVYTFEELSIPLSVSPHTLSRAIRGITWKHV